MACNYVADVVSRLEQCLDGVERTVRGKQTTFELCGYFFSREGGSGTVFGFNGEVHAYHGGGHCSAHYVQAGDLTRLVRETARRNLRRKYSVGDVGELDCEPSERRKYLDPSHDSTLKIMGKITPRQLQREEAALRRVFGNLGVVEKGDNYKEYWLRAYPSLG